MGKRGNGEMGNASVQAGSFLTAYWLTLFKGEMLVLCLVFNPIPSLNQSDLVGIVGVFSGGVSAQTAFVLSRAP
jgi:hypothetical protein